MIENGKYKLGVEGRIAVLEANYINLSNKIDNLSERFDKFMTNHWEHFKTNINDRVDELDAKLSDKIDSKKGVSIAIATLIGLMSTVLSGLVVFLLVK